MLPPSPRLIRFANPCGLPLAFYLPTVGCVALRAAFGRVDAGLWSSTLRAPAGAVSISKRFALSDSPRGLPRRWSAFQFSAFQFFRFCLRFSFSPFSLSAFQLFSFFRFCPRLRLTLSTAAAATSGSVFPLSVFSISVVSFSVFPLFSFLKFPGKPRGIPQP